MNVAGALIHVAMFGFLISRLRATFVTDWLPLSHDSFSLQKLTAETRLINGLEATVYIIVTISSDFLAGTGSQLAHS